MRKDVVRVLQYHGQLEAGNAPMPTRGRLTEESIQRVRYALQAAAAPKQRAPATPVALYAQIEANRREQAAMVMARANHNLKIGRYQKSAEIVDELRGPVKNRGGNLQERIRERADHYANRGVRKNYREIVAECGG
jgi:hypothetical protein